MTQVQKTFAPYEMLKNNVDLKAKIGRYMLYFPRFTNMLFYLLRPLYIEKETPKNEKFRWMMLSMGAGRMSIPETKAMRYAGKAMEESFSDVLKAVKNNEPVVWVEWIMQPEICEAFDVVSFNPEALNVYSNGKGTRNPPLLIEAAENQGTPIENCSALKLTVGSFLLNQIPKPALIVGGSHPCDSSVTVYQTLEYLTGAPSHTMDSPYWKDDESYAYYEENMWELIDFLETHLNRKIRWNKLKEMLERVNKINYYLREICEMSRAIPCPTAMTMLQSAWAIREVAIRSPHTLAMTEDLYHVVKKRFKKGKGIIKNEKIRILLWFPPMVFFPHYFQWMQENFGAVVVADFIGHVSTIDIDTSSKESMVRDLSISQMHLAMGRQCHGPMEFITDEMVKMIEEYSVDCMIFSGHNGCKHGWAGVKIVSDLCKEKKLPVLFLSVDVMDNRHTSEQQIKDQTTEFFKNHGWE